MEQFWNSIRNPLIRSARTFVQTTLGTWLTLNTVGQFERYEQLGDLGAIEVSVVAGAVAVVTLVHNILENKASYDRG